MWQNVYDIVRNKLIESADRQVIQRDKKAKDNRVNIDDRVFVKKVRNKPGDNKLSERFRGPYRVLSQKSPTVFRLKELQTNKEIEAHVENLKIVKERDVSLEIVPQARIPLQSPPNQKIPKYNHNP